MIKLKRLLKEQYEQRYYGEKSPYEKENASILSKGLTILRLAAKADAKLEGDNPGQIPHWLADEIYPNIKTKKDWNKLGDDLDKAITMVTNEPMRTTTTRELEKYSFEKDPRSLISAYIGVISYIQTTRKQIDREFRQWVKKTGRSYELLQRQGYTFPELTDRGKFNSLVYSLGDPSSVDFSKFMRKFVKEVEKFVDQKSAVQSYKAGQDPTIPDQTYVKGKNGQSNGPWSLDPNDPTYRPIE